jgi:hypothetical protein
LKDWSVYRINLLAFFGAYIESFTHLIKNASELILSLLMLFNGVVGLIGAIKILKDDNKEKRKDDKHT